MLAPNLIALPKIKTSGRFAILKDCYVASARPGIRLATNSSRLKACYASPTFVLPEFMEK